ncbi:MAG TPA: efflux RND transporter periplasmic adaptor subunit [Treponema sp.]|nr:efflux RND transporter periplasmic adaptor subunit [Treponema sp.]
MKSNNVRLNGFLAALALITLLVSTSCNKAEKDEKKVAALAAKAEAEKVVYAVTTVSATRGELNDYLEFGGDVAAKSNLDIVPDTAGKIAQVLVSVGETVKKDQVVAYIDPSRPGMNYENSPVKAPIAGTITAVNVVAGSMVSQQISIGKVSKMETLEITMHVPERFISKIADGQQAYLRFDAYPGEVFLARITEISPVLDPVSRTMGVKLSFIDKDPRIKSGMFARVKLITDTRSQTVKIPDPAIIRRFGDVFVFVIEPVEKKTVRRQLVTVGISVDEKAEILFGLSATDEVVVRGQTLLEDGANVNIVSKMQPLPEKESAR